tara:strand:- start:334 stop:579 length:246 start_codon:yes stop_codon:yes gene_type:complete
MISLNILNVRNKKAYEVVGVDRKDNGKPYTLDNIVACCGPCNSIKGSILKDHEMHLVGHVLRKVWDSRLAQQPTQTMIEGN